MAEALTPLEIFCSYAHADEVWRQKLETHLSLLKRQGLISLWHDRLIAPGTDWAKTIDTHLETASIILLLVSADFFASDYCYGIEMKRALERQEVGEVLVFPILVHPVDWKDAPFAHLQVLPTDAKPLATWSDQQRALADVAAGIRWVVEDMSRSSAGAPRTALPAIWNIPYQRNPFFLGRENELALVHQHLHIGQAMALSQPQAISGLGGIGKSQIAVEYAYRHHQDYLAVFWTVADTRESLVSGYIAIAELLNLPEKGEQDQTIVVSAVTNWLVTHTGWLLILDNADDLTVVREFIPSVFGGRILLTTRTQAMGRLAYRIEVDTLLPDTGALFLLRRSLLIAPDAPLERATAIDVDTAREISEGLGGLPLALDQAGAFIEETQCGLLDYQQYYRARRAYLLQRRGGLVKDHPDPVAATWSLSFEKVEQQNPIAADLLRLCAFLHPDAIPVELITAGASRLSPSLAMVAEDDIALNEAIAILGAYSLIRRNGPEKTLSAHRLVQSVLKDAMDEQTEQLWAERAMQAVEHVFPQVFLSANFTTWSQCERYLPHALACVELVKEEKVTSLKAIPLLKRIGFYVYTRATADLLSIVRGEESAMDIELFKATSHQHLETELLVQTLLDDRPYTMTTLNHLAAILYRLLGKYSEAELLYRRELSIDEKLHGPRHPQVASDFKDLATLYDQQGKYAEAKLLYERAREIEENPTTALGFQNLAFRYYMLERKYEQAESLYKRAIEINEQQLGSEHPQTAWSLYHLAVFYHEQRRYGDAELLFKRVLLISKQTLGEMHYLTQDTLRRYILLLRSIERNEEASVLEKFLSS